MFFISMETYGNKSRSIVRDQVGAAKTRNEITFLRVAFTIAAVTHITTRKKTRIVVVFYLHIQSSYTQLPRSR